MEKNLIQKFALTEKDKLSTLVEHKSTFDLEHAQLNIFETHQKAEKVPLTFNHLVLTSMIRGKKIMQLNEGIPFDYLPGESVLVKPGETMTIDFPEANHNNPSQCLALVIGKEKIYDTIEKLNSFSPKVDNKPWEIDQDYFHLTNSFLLSESINQLINVTAYDTSPQKDYIVNLKMEELIIRLLQSQARTALEKEYLKMLNNPFAAVVKYIKNNLSSDELSIQVLCRKACMSKANFYRKFVQEFGITPAALIQQERVKKAIWMLKNSGESISEIAFSVGFKNVAHFITFFKKVTGHTPKTYQMAHAIP